MFKSYTKYKQWVISTSCSKDKELSFEKVDERFHYVYRLTNLESGIHYYGSRTSKILPELDIGIKYFTSSKILQPLFKDNPSNYKIKIIKVFDNTKDKEIYESFLHQYFNCKLHDKFYNKANQTPFGHDTTGVKLNKTIMNCRLKDTGEIVTILKSDFDDRYTGMTKNISIARNIETNEIMCISTEHFNKSEKYVGVNKGKITVFDTMENKYKLIPITLYDKDRYVGVTKNMTSVINLETDEIEFVTSEFYKNNKDKGTYKHIRKDKVNVLDKTDGIKKSVTAEEYNLNKDRYVHKNKGNVPVYDKITGETKLVTKTEFNMNDNYESFHKGKVSCINKQTNKKEYITSEELKNNPNYESVHKGKLFCIDLRTGLIVVTTRKEFDKDIYFVGSRRKFIHCLDKNNEEHVLSPAEFTKDFKTSKNFKIK